MGSPVEASASVVTDPLEAARGRLFAIVARLAEETDRAKDLAAYRVDAASAAEAAERLSVSYWASAMQYRRLAAAAGDPRPPPPPPEPRVASPWSAVTGAAVRPPALGACSRRELPRRRPRRLPLWAALSGLRAVQRRQEALAGGFAAALAELRAARAAEVTSLAADPHNPPDAPYFEARDAWVRATVFAAQLDDLVPDLVRWWRQYDMAIS